MELMATRKIVPAWKLDRNGNPLRGAPLNYRSQKAEHVREQKLSVTHTTQEAWVAEQAEKSQRRFIAQNPPCGNCKSNTPQRELARNDGFCFDCREADNKRIADAEWAEVIEASKRPCKGCQVRIEPFVYKNGKGFCSSDCRSQFRAAKAEAERLAAIEASKEPCSECEQRFVPEELSFGWCASCKAAFTAEQFAACDGCGQRRGYSKLETIEIAGVERRICADSVECLELAFEAKAESVEAIAETATPASIAKRKLDAMIKYGVDENGKPKNRRKPNVPKSARKKSAKPEQQKKGKAKGKAAGSTGQ